MSDKQSKAHVIYQAGTGKKVKKKKKKKKKNKAQRAAIVIVAIIIISLLGYLKNEGYLPEIEVPDEVQNLFTTTTTTTTTITTKPTVNCFNGVTDVATINGSKIPSYNGEPYVVVNKNKPTFDTKKEKKAYESYSKLDYLGRCGTATAVVCKETMPADDREPINSVRPSGWHYYEYDFIDNKCLYNRCHLIGYQLTGENANEKNLITGTKYMNNYGMLPFENMVASYVRLKKGHVLYSVKPIFKDKELVARGVQIQAYSLDDNGKSICFNVFCYNVQPRVKINYLNGKSALDDTVKTTKADAKAEITYILNTKSKRFHSQGCSGIKDINPDCKQSFKGKRADLIQKGYKPCDKCRP